MLYDSGLKFQKLVEMKLYNVYNEYYKVVWIQQCVIPKNQILLNFKQYICNLFIWILSEI